GPRGHVVRVADLASGDGGLAADFTLLRHDATPKDSQGTGGGSSASPGRANRPILALLPPGPQPGLGGGPNRGCAILHKDLGSIFGNPLTGLGVAGTLLTRIASKKCG